MEKPSIRKLWDEWRPNAETDAQAMQDVASAREAWFEQLRIEPNIGETAEIAILRGLTNEEVLEVVIKAHPESSTRTNQISQYRVHMRRAGIPVPNSREIRKRRTEDRLAAARGL